MREHILTSIKMVCISEEEERKTKLKAAILMAWDCCIGLPQSFVDRVKENIDRKNAKNQEELNEDRFEE